MKVFPHYFQFGIWDVEDNTSYPVPSNEKDFVVGKKGFVVLMDTENHIDVSASLEPHPKDVHKLTEAQITVGAKGIAYGNIPGSTVGHLQIPTGNYLITLYGNNEKLTLSTAFHFSLTPTPPKEAQT